MKALNVSSSGSKFASILRSMGGLLEVLRRWLIVRLRSMGGLLEVLGHWLIVRSNESNLTFLRFSDKKISKKKTNEQLNKWKHFKNKLTGKHLWWSSIRIQSQFKSKTDFIDNDQRIFVFEIQVVDEDNFFLFSIPTNSCNIKFSTPRFRKLENKWSRDATGKQSGMRSKNRTENFVEEKDNSNRKNPIVCGFLCARAWSNKIRVWSTPSRRRSIQKRMFSWFFW